MNALKTLGVGEVANSSIRLLHTMIRVGDLQRSLEFYVNGLGMRELRREDYPEGRFTLVFLGYHDEEQGVAIEMTHNWDIDEYQHGTNFGHIALGVSDIYTVCAHLQLRGVTLSRPPAPMKFTANKGTVAEVIAFVDDPDGYQIELIEKPSQYFDLPTYMI